MMAIRYAFNHIRRSVARCLAIALVSLAFVVMIVSMQMVIDQQKAQLDAVMDEYPVLAVASDVYGAKTDDLGIHQAYVDLLYIENSVISQYIRDPVLKRGISCKLAKEDAQLIETSLNPNLIGVTNLLADPLLREENGVYVHYREGYDDSVLLGDEKVCLVNASLLKELGESARYVYLDFTEPIQARQREIVDLMARGGATPPGGEEIGLQKYEIIGTIEGGNPNSIYCPWNVIYDVCNRVQGIVKADSMAFYVRDNRKLSELKDILWGYFIEVHPGYSVAPIAGSPISIGDVALTIKDGELIRVASPLERSISFLQAILPALLALSVGIGFLASYLFMRGRKAEFALMRSLGTKRGSVFASAFVEQLTLCLAGTLVAMAAMFLLGGLTRQALIFVGIFLLCFLAGSAVSVGRIVSVNVMSAMKAKE